MAASAYASLVSLSHLLKQVLHPSKKHWIGFDRDQMMSLDDKVCSLVHLFENLSNKRQSSKFVTDELMNQLANACNEAEDFIDSFVADMFRAIKRIDQSDDDPVEFKNRPREQNTCFCEDIRRVTETIDLMNQKLIEIQKKMDDHHQHAGDDDALSTRRVAPITSSGKNVMVGFEDHLDQMMSRLTTTAESKLQIFPIVGMGGIGKTTLARNIYEKPIIVDYFHVRAWVTLSQTFTVREVLLDLLYNALNAKETKKEFNEKMSEKNDEEIGEQLRKRLFGRKYLIVIDDIWSTNAWDEFKRFFPDYRNGSRIVITTRLSNVAICLSSADNSYKLDFLDEDKSWNLFCDEAFSGQDCPVELVKIGKRIAKSCRGLPLSIVVIGGLLANSTKTLEYWEYVSENLNSIINSGDDDYCHKVLSLSYIGLPIHLKPCFLYMAMFPEDSKIKVSRLIKLWVAERFLKPIEDKSLEEVAIVYLNELIDRNLILVHKQGKTGEMNRIIIHDILRDLCSREAQKENFLYVTKSYSLELPKGIERIRRLAIHQSMEKPSNCVFDALQSASSARSLVCEFEWLSPSLVSSLKLLRVLDVVDNYSPEEIGKFYSMQYLAFNLGSIDFNEVTFPMHHWNLQSFICFDSLDRVVFLPPRIWEMTQLRHLKVNFMYLPDPPESDNGTKNFYILENLQTLFNVVNFRCTEEVVKRIPNLRQLHIIYGDATSDAAADDDDDGEEEEEEDDDDGGKWSSHYCLKNLVHLHKLESLLLAMVQKLVSMMNITFPRSLKRLTLIHCRLPWSDIGVVRSLPELEVLKLCACAFKGPIWDATEGEFVRLKFLPIVECDLKYWTTNNTYFPMLERLELECLELENIPSGIAEIPTLQMIELHDLKPIVITSAREIQEIRDDLGYDGLQIDYYNEEEGYCRI